MKQICIYLHEDKDNRENQNRKGICKMCWFRSDTSDLDSGNIWIESGVYHPVRMGSLFHSGYVQDDTTNTS